MSTATIPEPVEDFVVRSPAEVARLGTILGVWAHPDDEVYLSAGVMAAAAEAGSRVVVVTATRGERGTDDPDRWPPARLAPIRTRELAASLAVLDGGRERIEHRFLGDSTGSCYLDGALDRGPAEHAVSELAAIIDEVDPDTILTFGPDGITGHPDHRTVSVWTDQALQQLPRTAARVLHPVLTDDFAREFGDMAEPMDDRDDAFPVAARSDLAVDLVLGGELLDGKVAALRAHASQTGPLQDALGTERYRRFVAGEWFRERG